MAQTIKLMAYVDSQEDPLIQIVKTHLHNADSTLFETVKKFNKVFQREKSKSKQ